MRALDRIDCAILTALQNDGRLSNKELAAKVGLAPSSCLARVRRLSEDRVIRSFHARVDPEAVGIALQAMVFIRLGTHTRDIVDAFLRHCLAREEVIEVFHLTGAQDFAVRLAVRDAKHLRDVALEAFAGWPEVAHLETSLVFDHRGPSALPIYAVEGEAEGRVEAAPPGDTA